MPTIRSPTMMGGTVASTDSGDACAARADNSHRHRRLALNGTFVMSEQRWVPDHPDGSGWADVEWASVARGTRYHYRHGLRRDLAAAELSPYYAVVTRLESDELEPHENTYYVSRDQLADFLAEVTLATGAEQLWHIEPCPNPPAQSRVRRASSGS